MWKDVRSVCGWNISIDGIKFLEGVGGKVHEHETGWGMADFATVSNCSNSIIVRRITWCCFYYTTREPSKISRRLYEAGCNHIRNWDFSIYHLHRLRHLEWCFAQASWLTTDWHLIVISGKYFFSFETPWTIQLVCEGSLCSSPQYTLLFWGTEPLRMIW